MVFHVGHVAFAFRLHVFLLRCRFLHYAIIEFRYFMLLPPACHDTMLFFAFSPLITPAMLTLPPRYAYATRATYYAVSDTRAYARVRVQMASAMPIITTMRAAHASVRATQHCAARGCHAVHGSSSICRLRHYPHLRYN